MKSSNKNKRTDFENTWANALKNAEATPKNAVWENINSELLKADHIRIKGYYKTYKLVAAASVSLLLLASSAFTYFYFSSNAEDVLSETNQTQTSIDNENNLNAKTADQNQSNAVSEKQQDKSSIVEIETDIQPNNTNLDSEKSKLEETENIDSNALAYQGCVQLFKFVINRKF